MVATLGSVLVVDDDEAVGRVLSLLLAQAGHEAEHVPSAEAALARLEARPFDVVLSDLQMPGMDGLALLREVSARWSGVPVILLTAHGTVPLAVEAMKAGAKDFMLKPFDKDEVLYVVQKALTFGHRDPERPEAAPTPGNGELLGDSPAMRETRLLLAKAARGSATVLVQGETGTGKELAARALHEGSPRKDGPLITVNCAALPDTLLESELFGYEKGAFTGAASKKPGRVELAHGGTLFLDEVGDVSLGVQVKLLRVLQEKAFERVGGTQTIKVDVRFVTATHRDLEAMVRAGTFREDLFYRLAVVPIRLPPLREREGDIARLARHFCAEVGRANGRPKAALDAGAMEALCREAWPGNVRQLRNVVERLVVLADGDVIGRADAEHELRSPRGTQPPPRGMGGDERPLDAQRKDAEKDALLHALARAKDNRTLAARLLGVSRRTLYNKLREHALE
jgi:DNA-binding NtrC family response regulator